MRRPCKLHVWKFNIMWSRNYNKCKHVTKLKIVYFSIIETFHNWTFVTSINWWNAYWYMHQTYTCMCRLSNGLFFFERCSLLTVTVCAYKSNNARYGVTFRKRTNHWLKKHFKTFPTMYFNFFKNRYQFFIVYVRSN